MIQEKVLTASTIVPKNLYVERNADRQIRRVLEEMGRPGYILVARQLGKTNLLLHTKEILQDELSAIVYIDLSLTFNNEKECFRNIIDTAIETNSDLLDIVIDKINNNRLKNLPAQKEHDRELRILLNSIEGKLIFFLDEIDALTNTNYSNKIFAQIRSIYFARSNFPDYNRLSYILSGVLEPAEIINDKNISPFNIGEKIYLDDFTSDEFYEFILKASLPFDQKVQQRIYYWAGGNPRITWDLCSELENLSLESEHITVETVDYAVNKLYLTSFDTAPVDHIRALVEHNKSIRDAVQVINFNKGHELNDDIKRKLYLAGIISSHFESKIISIKNEILKKSLTDKWIQEIERKERNILDIAKEKFRNSNYDECIQLYNEFLEGNEFDKYSETSHYYNLGISYYHIEDYRNAIYYLTRKLYDKKKYADFYFIQIYILAYSYQHLKDYNNSIKLFKEIIDDDELNERSLDARLNLSAIYSIIDFDKYQNQIISFNSEVLAHLENGDVENLEDRVDILKTAAYFNQGVISKQIKNTHDAISSLQKALSYADLFSRPKILYELYQLEKDARENEKLLVDIVDLLINSKITPKTPTAEKPLIPDNILFYNILWEAFSHKDKKLFNSFSDYYISSVHPGLEPHMLYFNLGVFLSHSRRLAEGKLIFDEIFRLFNKINTSESFLKDCYKHTSLYYNLPDSRKKYLNFFEVDKIDTFDDMDLLVFNYEISHYLDQENYKNALKYINIADRYFDYLDNDSRINYAVIHFYRFLSYSRLNQVDNALKAAFDLKKFIKSNRSQLDKNQMLGIKEIENISRNIDNYITIHFHREPITRKSRKIPVNEKVRVKYKDGNIVEAKYKKVRLDIKNGLCEIIENT